MNANTKRHLTVVLVFCLACISCKRQAYDKTVIKDYRPLDVELENVDKNGIAKIDDKYLIINVDNAENGGITEIYRTLDLSSARVSDQRVLNGVLKFLRVEADGTAVMTLQTDRVYEVRAKPGENLKGEGIGEVGSLAVDFTDASKQFVMIRYLWWTSAPRQ